MFRCFLFVALLSLSASTSFCQIATQPVAQKDLPKNLACKGKLAQALRFTDKTGTYLLVTTQTGVQTKTGSDDNRSAHLYAYVYKMQPAGAASLLWQLNDGVDDCQLDVVTEFVPATLSVTDLDQNGIAEVWLMYRTACRGDVSGAETKIIMHEGTSKYALRGEGMIKAGDNLPSGSGTYTFDGAFQKAPAVFRQHAATLWKQNAVEILKQACHFNRWNDQSFQKNLWI